MEEQAGAVSGQLRRNGTEHTETLVIGQNATMGVIGGFTHKFSIDHPFESAALVLHERNSEFHRGFHFSRSIC